MSYLEDETYKQRYDRKMEFEQHFSNLSSDGVTHPVVSQPVAVGPTAQAIGDVLSKSDNLASRLKSLLAETDSIFDGKLDAADLAVAHHQEPEPEPPVQSMPVYPNGRNPYRPFPLRSKPQTLQPVTEGKEEPETPSPPTRPMAPLGEQSESIAELNGLIPTALDAAEREPGGSPTTRVANGGFAETNGFTSVPEEVSAVSPPPVDAVADNAAPIPYARALSAEFNSRAPAPSSSPEPSPRFTVQQQLEQERKQQHRRQQQQQQQQSAAPVNHGAGSLQKEQWQALLNNSFSQATQAMGDKMGRATAKLRGLEAKLAVVETDTQYLTLSIASSWRSPARESGGDSDAVAVRRIERMLSEGWQQQQRLVTDLEHRLAARVDRWGGAMQRMGNRVALFQVQRQAEQRRLLQARAQPREGWGWTGLEGRGGEEEELRGEVARLAGVNAQLSRKLGSALSSKMETERLKAENKRLAEREAALEETVREMQTALQTMRRREKEAERLEKDLEHAQALLAGGAQDSLDQNSDHQVVKLRQELNAQAELINSLRAAAGGDQATRDKYHKLQDDFFEVHRQHLEESSRCASLQRQLSQEKTLCLRKEQQLYHACAEVEILKEEIAATQEQLREAERGRVDLRKRVDAMRGGQASDDWLVNTPLSIVLGVVDKGVGGMMVGGEQQRGHEKQMETREQAAVRSAEMMKRRMEEVEEENREIRARLMWAERDGKSKDKAALAREDRVKMVEGELQQARDDLNKVDREKEALVASYEAALKDAGEREKEARSFADSLLTNVGRGAELSPEPPASILHAHQSDHGDYDIRGSHV